LDAWSANSLTCLVPPLYWELDRPRRSDSSIGPRSCLSAGFPRILGIGSPMSRTLCCLVVLGLLAGTAPLRAQEPVESELDFVRKLRLKGYSDLAREYLERMEKRKDPALAAVVPIEMARTLLALAREKEPEQRFGLFGQAREFLKDYTQKNAGKPEAATGTLELARLSSYEGQAILTKALRELDPAAQQDLAKPAEAKFILASGELEAAIKLLQGLVDDAKVSDTVKDQLKQELTQARFDRGINYIDQARTYLNTAKEEINEKRAKIIQEAKKVFSSLADEESLRIRAQANAWLMKIAMEEQDPGNVEKYYNRVIAHKEPEARAGQRWARLFDMQDVLTNAKNVRAAKLKTTPEKLTLIQKMGLSWLKDYPANVKSAEGQGVLWELASAYYLEAKEAEKDKKLKLDPELLLNQAQKYYGMLAQGEGDYSEKANQANLSISFVRMGSRKDFRTFEELYLKGQFELLEMQRIAGRKFAAQDGKEAEKLDRDWKDKLREVTRTFARAISLSTERTPIQKLDDARYYLTSAYLLSGDLYRAAIAGEALGRTRPPTRRAPAGAGYAIDAYASLLKLDYNDATRERLQALIDYVLLAENQKFWSSDPVTSVARYQMAMLYKKDGDFQNAISELERLPKEFPAYIYAQGQLVFIALTARRENQNLDDKEKKALADKVRAAIERMPPLPDDADASTAYMYFLAQIEKSKLMYADAYPFLEGEPLKAAAKYREMGKFVQGLANRLEKMPIKLTSKNRELLGFELRVMQKYSNLGLAEVEYREGKFDKVLEVTKPALDAVKKADDGKGGPIRMRDFQITGDTLGLALRAEVQNGKTTEAKALLDLIKRLSGDEDANSDAGARVVHNLLSEISRQVIDLKKENNPKKLKTVVESFTGFLDALLKDADVKKMPPGELRMLAEAFSGLERHGKSAELLRQFPAPKSLEGKKQPKDMKEEELQELKDYWSMQWHLAKELRKDKQYAEALKVVERWMKHDKALFQYPYGAMELNFILEDQGNYKGAMIGWNAFLKTLQPQVPQNPTMKQYFFEGYFYRTRTMFEYGSRDPTVKKKETWIDLAAKHIVDLEFNKNRDGWEAVGARYQELLRMEPELNKVYEKLKSRVSAQK
jgi:hypothetical protein